MASSNSSERVQPSIRYEVGIVNGHDSVCDAIEGGVSPHEWELVSKTYAEGNKQADIATSADITKALFLCMGVTTILRECSRCRLTEKIEMIGKESCEYHDGNCHCKNPT